MKKRIQSRFVGIDTWTGEHYVSGFCALYANTYEGEGFERIEGGKADWYRNRWVRGTEACAVLGEEIPAGPREESNDAPNTNVIGVDGRTFAECFEREKPSPDVADLARVAFEAYGQSTGGKTWDGKPIPPFETIRERTPHVAAAWEAAVVAVLNKLESAR